MKDTIYREAAIDEAEQWIKTYNSGRGGQRERDAIKHVISGIKKLPSAQPERKKGSWIEDGYNHYKAVCSECGEPCATYVMGKPRDNFCKWCGADMRGEQNGQ